MPQTPTPTPTPAGSPTPDQLQWQDYTPPSVESLTWQPYTPPKQVSVPVASAIADQPMGTAGRATAPPPPAPLSLTNQFSLYSATGEQARREAAELPGRMRSAARVVLPAAGAMAGAALGPPGLAGAALYSGLGAGVGSVAASGVEAATGAPPSFESATRQAATDVATGGGGEVGARGVIAAGAKFAAPFAKKVTTAGRQAYNYLRGHVTPGQVSESSVLRFLDNIMEGSIFGSGQHRAFIQEQGALLDDQVQRILHEAAPARGGQPLSREATGQVWQDLQKAAREAEVTIGNRLYDQVDQIATATSGSQVSLTPLVERATAEAERRGALGMALRGGPGMRTLRQVEQAGQATEGSAEAAGSAMLMGRAPGSPEHTVLLQALADAGVDTEAMNAGVVTFRQAHEIRSALGRQIADATKRGDSTTKGIASQLRKTIDEAMTASAGGAGSPLRTAYDEATAHWAKLKDTFDQGVLAKVAKADPRLVVDTIIKPHAVEDILKARRAIGPEGWRDVEATWLQSILTTKNGELTTGRALMNTLGRYGPETLTAVMPAGTSDGVWQIARVLSQLQTTKGGHGRVWIALMQGGAAGGLLLGQQPGKAAAILLGPAALARVLLSAPMRRWLTIGLKTPVGSPDAVRATTQLLTFLAREGLVSGAGPPGQQQVRAVDQVGGRGGGPGPRTFTGGGAPPGMAPLAIPPRPADPTQPPPAIPPR